MPGSTLDFSNAYDDTPSHDEPMFSTLPRRIGYDSPGSRAGSRTPQAIPWRSRTTPSSLQLTNGPSGYLDNELSTGTRAQSPLALEFPRSPASYRSPPPSYLQGLPPQEDDSDIDLSTAKTPYEVLGIDEYASADDIKAAYKKKARKYHPDKCLDHEKDEATAKFQLISEAFAILGDPTRRAEYDLIRKQRRNTANTSSPYGSGTASRTPSFKSTFIPEASRTGNAHAVPRSDRRPDLRGLSPFVMFDRMFPHLAGGFKDHDQQYHRSPDIDQDLSSISGFRAPPPVDALQSSIRPGQSRRMQERYERAKMDKHGNLEVSQGQRSIKVHKSGSFTFESRTFSASSSGGNMNMLQAMMASMNGMGGGGNAGFDGSGGGLGGSMFGNMNIDIGFPDMGDPVLRPPSSRGRRQSFGALESSYRPSSPGGGYSSSRALQRRPSISFEEPLALDSGLADYGSSDLTPYRGGDRSLVRSRY